jgi:hypothetical protein
MANPRQDLGLENNDIIISNGDLTIVFSDQQHVIDTMNAYKGWWKEHPLDGVAIQQFLGAPNGDEVLIREIKVELNKDGYATSEIRIDRTNKDDITIYPNAVLI